MKPGNILEGSRTPLSANDREVCARRAITVLWELHEYIHLLPLKEGTRARRVELSQVVVQISAK